MVFNTDLSLTDLLLLSSLAAVTLFLITVYRRRITRALRHRATQEASAIEIAPDLLPPLSVIVYTRDNAEDLARMLPDVLAQDYAPGFEVIVVNDGSSEATKDVVGRLALQHGNIKLTFIPDEAHNLSRRKLAITLGIKAARNERVVITTAEAIIPSNGWLRAMGRHFAAGKEIVIGHAVLCYGNCRRAMLAFDEAVISSTYLGAAACNHAYRGNGFNIAYTKQLFYANKGFARSLNIHGGDDDIFINEISNRHNAAAELSTDGTVCINTRDLIADYRHLKTSHLFTSRFLPKGARRFVAAGPLLMWLSIALAVAAGIMALPNLLPATVALLLLILQFIIIAKAWNKTAAALSIGVRTAKIPLLMLRLPFHNLRYRIRSRRNASRNYTWTLKRTH